MKQKGEKGLLPYSRAPHPTAVAFCPANSSLEPTETGGIHTGEKSERSTWGDENLGEFRRIKENLGEKREVNLGR